MLRFGSALFPLLILAPVSMSGQPQTPAAEPLKKINFDGGELTAYIQKVRAEFPDANIVIDSGLGNIKVPSAPLPKVSLTGALQWVTNTRGAQINGVLLQPTRTSRDGEVFLFTSSYSAIARRQAADDQQVTSIALTRYTERGLDVDPNVIAEAIRDELGKQRSGRGTVTFNPKTGMFLVTGTSSDIGGANNVLEQLTNSRRTARQVPQLTDQVNKLTVEVARLRDSVNTLLRRQSAAATKESKKN
jgi:hypothetical protein